PLPPRAVLFVAGDNDTYPLWFAQQVLHLRTDVTVVTMPLLGAAWYPAELQRRYGLRPPSSDGRWVIVYRRIADASFAQGRPVAASLSVGADDRNRIWPYWKVIGAVAVALPPTAPVSSFAEPSASSSAPWVDTVATVNEARRISALLGASPVRESLDPA